MNLKTLVLTLLATAIGSIAAPTGEVDATRVASVYMCKDADWKGQCQHIAADNKCHPLEEDWKFAVSSIGPDVGVTCAFYLMPNCLFGVQPVGQYKTYKFPGEANLGNQWNDKFWSFSCYYKP
ncbi:hypothetical protein FN846DRAFT_931587 [Sphaerosporella brunnea]|uniref:Beta/gamma crystallin 'Greek key' domain-containing protein n=1 Tax=Sphaerosporella brunnea TaxID=1250544 RepID=A0A5J5F7R0_9PEZI|nr:hypothetical protein FN846DRAFT_931587 [Sphaerosporella brunnea]